jgi:hypothetical protein
MYKPLVTFVLLTLMLGSCSDAPTVPDPVGTIVVSVRASGGDLDNDFQVVLGDGSRRDVVANTTVSLNTAAPAQRVELQGVAANCAVAGQNPVSVDVPAGSSVAITFDVICATTGIHIRTRTNGFAEPAGYEVLVENRASVKIAANDSLLMSRLEPGTYSVALALPGSHCRVAGMPQLQVAVANRTVTPVLFEITCVPRAHTEKIAYMWLPPNGRSYMISLMNPDGSGAFDLAAGSSPDWSPDGAKLAYSTLTCDSEYDPCSGGIVVADPESRHFTALSNGKSGYSPTWGPTDDILAFVEFSPFGAGTYTLKIIRLDGSPSVGISLPSHLWIGDLDWSPNGRRIAFRCVSSSANDDICVVNTDGSGFVRLTSGPDSETNPAWSPDGSQIAFTTWAGGTSMVPPSIAVMAPDGSGFRRITTGGSPAWSPDGTRLVFEAENGLFTVRLDGSDLKRLTSGKHTAPAWRP